MGRERLEAEFGCYSEWLAEACAELQADPVPGVSRGTGRPALLELARERLDIRTGHRILDLGCGLGGPSAWLMRTTGADIVGVDLMWQSIAGLHRLVPGLSGLVASGRALPFHEGAFDRAWSLGVLEMVADKATAIEETYRVLRPGGRFFVYDYVLVTRPPDHAPQADRFSPPHDTRRCLEQTGFIVEEASELPPLPSMPPEWAATRDAVRGEVRRRHGTDTRFRIVEEELSTFRALVGEGVIAEWMFVASKPGP